MQNGKLEGYGVIRKCRNGYKIGPLFANNPKLAESLFLSLKSVVKPAEPVYLDTSLDTPEVNQAAVALAERHNMKVTFETARTYKENVHGDKQLLSRLFYCRTTRKICRRSC
jgi:hypothetical protein